MKKFYSLLFLLCSITLTGGVAAYGGFRAGGRDAGLVVRQETINVSQTSASCSPAGQQGVSRLYQVVSSRSLRNLFLLSCTVNSPSGAVPGTGVFIKFFNAADNFRATV